MIKVRAHTCYLGKSGYSAHSRSFFRHLSTFIDLRIRNFTWDDKPVFDEIDLKILDTITLSDGNKYDDYHISHAFPSEKWNHQEEFKQDVDIVLMDMNHHYFYDNYDSKIKIAYTVWESTELPVDFFNQLLKFDYLWVVSSWHKEQAIKQGFPEYKIHIVNEGVDSCFKILEHNTNNDPFRFMFFGRWDYRKAVPEILNSFLQAFPTENVELLISADNPYAVDGMHSTEERLKFYGVNDKRIKILHFIDRDDYISTIESGNVLITCARSEGWNIPLIEAMSAGTPVIFSNWGAQLEFAKGSSVNIQDERLASIGANLGFAHSTPGYYCEPDFSHLTQVLRDVYEHYDTKKELAVTYASEIRQKFSWKNIAENANNLLLELLKIDSVAVIISHADTNEKQLILKNSLLALKKQGYDVIISSHIFVPEVICKLADHVIIETDNPVISHEDFSLYSDTIPVHFLQYNDFNVQYSFEFNHGYAALKLMINGLRLSNELKYKKTHIVNYDYVINDYSVLKNHSDLLSYYDSVCYKWDETSSINTGFFSINTHVGYHILKTINSKKEYFKFKDIVILEYFLYKLFVSWNTNIKILNISDISINNIINAIQIPTYPKIEDGTSIVYLCKEKESDNLYVGAIGDGAKSLNIQAKIRGMNYEFIAEPDVMHFYSVSQDDLNYGNGIEIILPDFNKKIVYNLNSKTADCEIQNKNLIKFFDIKVNFNFFDGPFVEIIGCGTNKYKVEFIDSINNKVYYEDTIGVNCWVKCSKKYYVKWLIKITDKTTGEVLEIPFSLENKCVLVSVESKSLGDTIAWISHIEEFRKKHNCNIYVSTFHNKLFNKYDNINFIEPGKTVSVHASYKVGVFYMDDNVNFDMHPSDFRKKSLHSVSCDILGLDFSFIRPELAYTSMNIPIKQKYVCLGMNSTAQTKYWNNKTGWQEVVDYFINRNYKVVMLSNEENGFMGNFYPKGVIFPEGKRTLDLAMNYLKHCEMFIGISSGLSWLSWALNIPTTIISGWTWPVTEIDDKNVIRIFKGGVCTGCFNKGRLDPSDWNFCPEHKNTERQFECSKIITGNDVINAIQQFELNGYYEKSIENIVQESYELGMVQNHKEILEAAEFFKSLNVKSFIEIGTDQGGTFAIWSKLSDKNGKKISIDLPHGQFGKSEYDLKKRDDYLKSLSSNTIMIHGNSHDDTIQQRLQDELNDERVDFLFIDGDHTYEGVKQDYQHYKRFVKPNGWIGFHDIKDTEYHRNANCRVDRLWYELKKSFDFMEEVIPLNYIEFIDGTSDYGGIGFIQMNI